MAYVVKLAKANSASGVAYIGPGCADGFGVESESAAYRFSQFDAERFADMFRNRWRGFYGFGPSDITVEAA